jgi:hypothetical protein
MRRPNVSFSMSTLAALEWGMNKRKREKVKLKVSFKIP